MKHFTYKHNHTYETTFLGDFLNGRASYIYNTYNHYCSNINIY